MNVGRVNNVNYTGFVGQVNSPALRRATQGTLPNASVASPAQRQGNVSLFLSADGDRAEISDRARGFASAQPYAQPFTQSVIPNNVTFRQFDLPSQVLDWNNLDFSPPHLPIPTNMNDSIPAVGLPTVGIVQPQVIAPADIADEIELIPHMPGSGLLDSLNPDGACQTCADRRYVDKSDDASVSFQTPTSISPAMSAAVVASHEQEHVRNEQARAHREGRQIISQTVSLTMDSCPECNRSYVSGGTTRTTSVGKSEESHLLDSEESPESDSDAA